MKHDWECVKNPLPDKLRYQNPVTLEFVEKRVSRPGGYMCKNCGHFQVSNYPPPEDWQNCGIIPNCETEVARKVTEE